MPDLGWLQPYIIILVTIIGFIAGWYTAAFIDRLWKR